MRSGFTLAALCAAAGTAFAGSPVSPSGAPLGDASTPSSEPAQAAAQAAGLDDAGLPLAQDALQNAGAILAAESEAGDAPRGTYQGEGPLPATSTMTVELDADASHAARQLAAQAENAWARGDVQAVHRAMDMLRATGETAYETYSYHEPIVATGRSFGDSTVKVLNADEFDFNVDTATGNLFAVINEPNNWTIHISTDNGQTWAETFSFNGDAAHTDLMIVDGFVYVGYVPASPGDEVRLRRFDTATGSADGTYGFQTVFDAGPLGTINDIAVEGNQDNFNNRIYVAAIQSDNTLQWVFATTNDPTNFMEDGVNTIVDADGNLDMHWDTEFGGSFLHICYTTTTDQIRHIGKTQPGWTASTFLASYNSGPVRVAAFDGTAIVIYNNNSSAPFTTGYRVSYNDGDTFSFGSLGGDTTTSVFGYDVAARFGYGTAAIYNTESGTFDDVLLERRPSYAPGLWIDELPVNATDAFSGGETRIEALPPISSGATYSYGVMFEGQNFFNNVVVYFTRVEDCNWLGDVDNDGDVELDDLLAVLANFGTFNPVGDTDGNGFVDLNDLLTVLADFGNDCSQI